MPSNTIRRSQASNTSVLICGWLLSLLFAVTIRGPHSLLRLLWRSVTDHPTGQRYYGTYGGAHRNAPTVSLLQPQKISCPTREQIGSGLYPKTPCPVQPTT